jgi:DNA-binding NtrC family response regulator
MNHASRPTVLFVDDEERILRTLAILFRPHFDVLSTTDPQEALQWLSTRDVHVLVSDQRMPLMSGSELLARAREISPVTVRILLTGYSDLDAAIEAVNGGEIWRYLNKPWTIETIQTTLRDAAVVASAQRAMQAGGSSKRETRRLLAPEVLLIDTDPESRSALPGALPAGTVVHHADSLTQAIEILGRRPVGVVVTEISVGGDDMTHLLRSLKQRYPDVVGIVVTSLRDTPRLIRLINQTQVFRYLPKPLRQGMLSRALESALARHEELRNAGNLVPATLRVDDASTEVERTLSQRIGDYLGRLRGRQSTIGA